jgi:hypothetical protein
LMVANHYVCLLRIDVLGAADVDSPRIHPRHRSAQSAEPPRGPPPPRIALEQADQP